jgi:serine/threonine protein kinase
MGVPPTPDISVILARHAGLTVLEEIRAGGQKSVWKVSFENRSYALKVITLGRPTSEQAGERAKREITIMRECESPHLVTFGPWDLQEVVNPGQRIIYYLEEWIDGTPLDKVPKPMPLRSCKELGLQLGRAVGCLWAKGYLHRDIKPLNIMLRTDGQTFVLLDVGLALDTAGPSITATGGVVGTPMYLSPDQIRLAKRQLDFRSDLHAVGVCMYECLTAFHPLWNPHVPQIDLRDNILNLAPRCPRDFRPEVPELLEEVVLRLLEKEANLRYARVEHFMQDLELVEVP